MTPMWRRCSMPCATKPSPTFSSPIHRDHSPAVPKIKAATGAKVFAQGPHRLARPLHIGETARRLDASADMDFRPDVALADGEVVSGRRLDARSGDDAGPHRQSHGLCIQGIRLLFAGDHVMAWSTTIVAPPDGAMSDYMASLDKLALPERRSFTCPAMARRSGRHRVMWRHLIRHRQGARSVTVAPARQRLSRHPDFGEGRLYRARSAAHRRRRFIGPGAHGRSRRPRRGRRPTGRRRSTASMLGGRALGRRLTRRRRRFLFRHRRRQHVVDIVDQIAHPRSIGADIVAAVARGRAHIDAGAVAGRTNPHHHIVTKAEDRRARHRLDDAVAARRGAGAAAADPVAAASYRRCASGA